MLAVGLAAADDLQLESEETSRLPRHQLERAALVDPEAALRKIAVELAALDAASAPAEASLLQLARANACRVVGDWHCQRDAGADAAAAGAAAADPVLEVRGLIAEARGAMALDDTVYGERILGRAETLLLHHPNNELRADIQLAYSSLSYRLGRHLMAMAYAQRGLDALGPNEALPMRVRLLRNLARGQMQMADYSAAERSLDEALSIRLRPEDPKLLAEVHLELARLARRNNDAERQRGHGGEILKIAEVLENTQLGGLGHEVLAYAALDAGELTLAKDELNTARDRFAELNLASDELRLMPSLLRLETDAQTLAALARRLLELDQQVDERNRNQAAADFDLRLQHANQELDLARLQASSDLAETRLSALRERSRLTSVILLLVLLVAVLCFVGLANQRRSNRRLQAALDSRRRALLVTSHELRNPIAGVVGLAELLLESPLDERQRDKVRALMSAAESIGKLAQDLLDRGRAESGELSLSPHPVVLADLLMGMQQLFAVQAKNRGIDFLVELDPGAPPAVIADGERLQQVLTNLLSNALKFTDYGQISLRVENLPGKEPGQARLRFEVKDSGPGLSEEDKARLFEPFTLGTLGRKHTFGAGLGLSICHDLITLMDSRIQVLSSPGLGTSMQFELQLPIERRTKTIHSPVAKPATAADATRVLVVDDDPDLQVLFAAQLEAFGCYVDTAANADECREHCARTRYDLVLLDDQLQRGERGSEIAVEIPEADGSRPWVVIVSGNCAPDELAQGIDEWITKPMRLDHLGQIIRALRQPVLSS